MWLGLAGCFRPGMSESVGMQLTVSGREAAEQRRHHESAGGGAAPPGPARQLAAVPWPASDSDLAESPRREYPSRKAQKSPNCAGLRGVTYRIAVQTNFVMQCGGYTR